jgi:hypothetical protein
MNTEKHMGLLDGWISGWMKNPANHLSGNPATRFTPYPSASIRGCF